MAQDVRQWLEDLGLGEYADAFEENAVDSDVLPSLTNDDLKDIGVTAVGKRRKLLNAIAGLSLGETVSVDTVKAAAPERRPLNAERRQLTVMFCDMVGSTALSESMDPEEYRDVLATYRSTAKHAIDAYDGYIAKYMGDGLLVYFGYPQAHEEDPERAVRAALDIIDAVTTLKLCEEFTLQVRIGIATGLVLAGDMIGDGVSEDLAVLGDTPNLAARLQGLAARNEVLIADSTRRLVEGRFDLEAQGAHRLKGISEAVTVYRAVGLNEVTRFQAARAGLFGPLLGRDEELGMLLRRWELAIAGEGQVVLLGGEPGIGKSRLAEALRKEARAEQHTLLRYQCSPYHMNSAFYPVIAQIEYAAGFDRDDEQQEKLNKLEALFGDATNELWLIASLLSLPTVRYSTAELTPEKQKSETISFLLEQVASLARTSPTLIMLEDIHWVDHSTRELFDALSDMVAQMRVLLVVTYRPEFEPVWANKGHATQLMLNRLGRRDVGLLIQSLTGDTVLPDEVVQQILQKTDGIPLFVEELTKDVLESGQVGVPNALVPELQIPSTIQDSLMARLDRLGKAKEVAQVGATIGREFPYALVAAAWERGEDDLREGLEQLKVAGMLYQRGRPPHVSYFFKHALVRDAAYATLLRERRRALHRSVAIAMKQYQPAITQAQPELLAHHLTEAGEIEAALEQWLCAGQLAFSRSGALEAQAHLERSRALIALHSCKGELVQQELDICVALGPVYMTTKGAHAPETAQVYARARELSETVGDQKTLFKVAWGQWHVKQLSEGPESAMPLAKECLILSRQLCDEGFELQAHHAGWSTQFFRGEFGSCLQHAEQGCNLYDLERHADHRFTYGGHDPGACSHYFAGLSHWFLGRPDESARCAAKAVEVARCVEHPFSMVTTLLHAAHIAYLRREHSKARRLAREGVVLCEQLGFPTWLPGLAQLHDWALVIEEGDVDALARMGERIAPERVAGQLLPANHLFLVDACTHLRQFEQGLSIVEKGLDLAEALGHRWVVAELYRLNAVLLMLAPSNNQSEVETKLHLSLKLARKQQARSIQLRSATALGWLRLEQGEPADAMSLLMPLFQTFNEGFDTLDLKEARALLEKLS